jgi:hypothetical protein
MILPEGLRCSLRVDVKWQDPNDFCAYDQMIVQASSQGNRLNSVIPNTGYTDARGMLRGPSDVGVDAGEGEGAASDEGLQIR